MRDDNADIKKLEQGVYDALKQYYEALMVEEDDTLDSRDIGFYITACCTRGQHVQISGHMMTPCMDQIKSEETIAIGELITAGWPTVTAGLCSFKSADFYDTVMLKLKQLQQHYNGVGHA